MDLDSICGGGHPSWWAAFFILLFEYWMGRNRLKANSSIEFVVMIIVLIISALKERYGRHSNDRQ